MYSDLLLQIYIEKQRTRYTALNRKNLFFFTVRRMCKLFSQYVLYGEFCLFLICFLCFFYVIINICSLFMGNGLNEEHEDPRLFAFILETIYRREYKVIGNNF